MNADWKYNSARMLWMRLEKPSPFTVAQTTTISRATTDASGRVRRTTRWAPNSFLPRISRDHSSETTGRAVLFKFVGGAEACAHRQKSRRFSLTLVFGNSLYYWNQNVLVRHSETLKREYRQLMIDYPDGFVEIHPDDAKRQGIRDGGKVRLSVPTATSRARARITSEVMVGTILSPHFMREVEQQVLGPSGDSFRLVPVRLEKDPE